MKLIEYLREKGIRRAVEVVYQYKLGALLGKIMLGIFKSRPLQNIIMIESHNDFDCNGGAFYDYLLEKGLNNSYKIVWMVRYKVKKKLPDNVICVPLFGPSIRKAYYASVAKYFLYDCEGAAKVRDDQIMVYCSHGSGGLKSVKGKLSVSDRVNYVLVPSQQYAPVFAEQCSIKWPDDRLVSIGYPVHDIFFRPGAPETDKITDRKYKKIILWMPTFRRGGGFRRNDSTKEQKLGIPLIDTMDEYGRLNDYLRRADVFLVIKIHPKQDLSNLRVGDCTNIKVLTGKTVKELDIDNYRLMKASDALVSDYSSAASDYLLLNRPIGYTLDDRDEYRAGFIHSDLREYMAGHEIYTFRDMLSFFDDVVRGDDPYRDSRKKLKNRIYQYYDGEASKRLAHLLGLE